LIIKTDMHSTYNHLVIVGWSVASHALGLE